MMQAKASYGFMYVQYGDLSIFWIFGKCLKTPV